MSNDGGPAFPISTTLLEDDNILKACSGMSLRDYFAAQVMAGEIALNGIAATDDHKDMDARAYYKMADAMLRARNT